MVEETTAETEQKVEPKMPDEMFAKLNKPSRLLGGLDDAALTRVQTAERNLADVVYCQLKRVNHDRSQLTDENELEAAYSNVSAHDVVARFVGGDTEITANSLMVGFLNQCRNTVAPRPGRPGRHGTGHEGAGGGRSGG